MTKARDLASLVDASGIIDNAKITLDANEIPSLDTAKITSGTFADARISSSSVTQHVNLTNLNATNLTSGTVPLARLGSSGTASSSTFLRGDNTWGSAGATAGQVIQVVSATDTTQRSTTSTSFATGSNTLSVTITPSSTSNKIFITTSFVTSSGTNGTFFTIYRNGTTNLGNGNVGMAFAIVDITMNIPMTYLDSPSTTSATTYQVYFRQENTGGTSYIVNQGSKGSITVFEIKG